MNEWVVSTICAINHHKSTPIALQYEAVQSNNSYVNGLCKLGYGLEPFHYQHLGENIYKQLFDTT